MTAFPQAAEQASAEDGIVFTKPIDLEALVHKVGEILATDATGQT